MGGKGHMYLFIKNKKYLPTILASFALVKEVIVLKKRGSNSCQFKREKNQSSGRLIARGSLQSTPIEIKRDGKIKHRKCVGRSHYTKLNR